ncbi:hydantoin utilization protein [Bdellovibrio bacteriovorus]|uniref:Hydantoin utilization protein n=1 Tax=Bdellovibrio bacteriovorus TaxID=959 RepID=A0A161PPV2_BDEBC|nr:hydantoinase/oxoprolinase N-terminal domain-containing protein [Bdellovibrio bacteriovorus]KYG62656.1 hydantoin utilization protein [Bdellovibrio bacteriovorus]
MQNRFLLGVSVGESFAEYSLLSDTKPVAQKRVYLARESLKQSLSQFVNDNAGQKPTQAFVSLRLPKKLLSYELSGAVAHITTEGFEHWLHLCAKSPEQTLTSKDLLFSVKERVLANGTVEIPLDINDLEPVVAKLQMMDCKKVCLHFLHSATHPANLQVAKNYLQEKGLEVFTPENNDNPHEVSRWNKNALNATISSVFTDRKAEIVAALEGVLSKEEIYFLNSSGKLFQEDSSQNVNSLFSAGTALGHYFGALKKADVLYLGLESFLLISGSSWSSSWESPWGAVEVPHLKTIELGVQPTLGIALNTFGRFDFSKTQEGWEPGPMFLGRGQKPALLDLWAENAKLTKLPGLEDRFSPQGIQRFKNSFFALSKISQTRDSDISHLTKEMQSLTLQRLAMEAYLNRQSEKLVVTGPLATVFANAFKKDSHTLIETEEFSESYATALCGHKALQESL